MKKRLISLVLSAVMTTALFVGCGSSDNAKSDLKVGMVTDAGTIDDKSFNQGTWEGIKAAEAEYGITSKYLQPKGLTKDNYLEEIKNLYDAGFKFIITPGFKFETAIFEAQDKYADAKFVIIDGSPNNGEQGDKNVAKVGDNTISVYFAEEQGGFLAGIAAAVQLETGDLGFIGGMKIPAVQKFNWGFQQGVAYANENLGTSVKLEASNIVYEGSFDNAAAGQQIAAQMYNRGVKAIFTAAGGTGKGAITEAKNRVGNGEEVWVIGVDVDQYTDGEYGSEGKSVILTSAMKKLSVTAMDIIKSELDGNFQGGKTLIFDIANDGVGIPEENPNLSEKAVKAVDDVIAKIKAGDITISAEQGSLIE